MTENDAAHLLIVDDEPVAVENLAYALSKSGYQITTCTSGQEGAKAIDTMSFDVVLTDLRMELVDGIEILFAPKASCQIRLWFYSGLKLIA